MSRLSRIIFLIFVFLLVAVSIYLVTTVWGNLNSILSFTLSAVGSIASVIGLWAILFPLRDTHHQTPAQQIAPVQITINQTQTMAAQLPASMMSNTKQPDERAAQEASQQQPIKEPMPQPVPSTATSQSAQQDDVDEATASNLIRDLIRSSPSIFDAVIAYYDPPSGVAETGTKANKARELVNTARNKGDLRKLIDAYWLAMGEQPLKKRVQQELTDGTRQAAEVAGQTMSIEREQNKQEAPSSSNVSQKQQETRESQTETNHARLSETTPVTIVQQARNDIEKAQLYVQQANAQEHALPGEKPLAAPTDDQPSTKDANQRSNISNIMNVWFDSIIAAQPSARDAIRLFNRQTIFLDECDRALSAMETIRKPTQELERLVEKHPYLFGRMRSKLVNILHLIEEQVDNLAIIKKAFCPSCLEAPLEQRQEIEKQLKDILINIGKIQRLKKSLNKSEV